jgi:hypothetical protein
MAKDKNRNARFMMSPSSSPGEAGGEDDLVAGLPAVPQGAALPAVRPGGHGIGLGRIVGVKGAAVVVAEVAAIDGAGLKDDGVSAGEGVGVRVAGSQISVLSL